MIPNTSTHVRPEVLNTSAHDSNRWNRLTHLVVILLFLIRRDSRLLLRRFGVDDPHFVLIHRIQILLLGRDHDHDFVLVVSGFDDTEILVDFVRAFSSP